MNANSIAAFTGGKAVPSARFRVRQFIEPLRRAGIELSEFASTVGSYPPRRRRSRPLWFLANLLERASQIATTRRFDAVLFQRELISTFLTLERFATRPRILDVDDAIWVHPRGAFAGRLAKQCDAVICGNRFVQSYFASACARTFVLPTAVDTERFRPSLDRRERSIIGWSGTSGNLVHLHRLEPALRRVFEACPNARLRVVCDRPPSFDRLDSSRVEYIAWSLETETMAIRDLAVGLMPLDDTDWSRGKCSYKMLTYMACGVAPIVSPIGMNAEVLAYGDVGLGVDKTCDWADAIRFLLTDEEARARFGSNGRRIVEEHFSVTVLARRLAEILRTVIS